MSNLGSKAISGAYQAIVALMPPHDTYIEPFVGSGAVLLRKEPASRSFAIDLDAAAIRALPADYPDLEKRVENALDFLARFDWLAYGRVLIYADPPYLHSTRTSQHRYQHELTDNQHLELLALLRRCPADVILSGYPSAIYDQRLAGWNSREFQVMSRGGVRTEKLWFNFEPSTAHWITYTGKNFTDRQRIKRKAATWAKRYARFPPGERMAILAALLAIDGSVKGGTA
jgi:DNA adenine methylase